MDKCCLGTFDGSQRRSLSTCFRRTVSVPSFHCEKKRPLRIQACSNTQLGCSSSAGCLARGSGQRRPDSFSLPFRYNVRQQHQQLRPLSQRTFLCPVNEQAPAQPWKSSTCQLADDGSPGPTTADHGRHAPWADAADAGSPTLPPSSPWASGPIGTGGT
jgi:hypothetical protein